MLGDKSAKRPGRPQPWCDGLNRMVVDIKRDDPVDRRVFDLVIAQRAVRQVEPVEIVHLDPGVDRQPLEVVLFLDHAPPDQHLFRAEAEFSRESAKRRAEASA